MGVPSAPVMAAARTGMAGRSSHCSPPTACMSS